MPTKFPLLISTPPQQDADAKGYVCPRCNKQFSPLDIVTLIPSPQGFECDRCNTLLVDDDDSAEVKSSQERLGRLMDQLKPVIDLLKKIDEVVVPQNEFDDALRQSIPVPRVKNVLTGATAPGGYMGGPGGSGVGNEEGGIPYAKSGNNNSFAPAPLEITFTNSDEQTARDKAADVAKRNAQMEQNALPVWHTQSTVSGEITKLGLKEEAARKEREGFLGNSSDTADDSTGAKKSSTAEGGVQVDAIQEYYAAVAAQRAREEAEEEEEEDGDGEDDEDEFEDVAIEPSTATTTATGTPIINPTRKGKEKDKEEESDSSSSEGKAVLSQAGNGPPSKKVKIQSPPVPVPVPVTGAAQDEDEDDDDEGEDEFEDAI